MSNSGEPATAVGADWVRRFHAGEPALMAEMYEAHFARVASSARTLVTGADLENVVHNVFLHLLGSEAARRSFQGGAFDAWIAVVARNEALRLLRDRAREARVLGAATRDRAVEAEPPARDTRLEAQRLIQRFRHERLPPRWAPVFEARFLRQLSQREAAAELGMRRTTLAYQEFRITQLLKQFFLTVEREP